MGDKHNNYFNNGLLCQRQALNHGPTVKQQVAILSHRLASQEVKDKLHRTRTCT